MVRYHAHATHQVADRTHQATAVGRALIVLLPAKPGEIAFFAGLLFQCEFAQCARALLLLLLLLLLISPISLLNLPLRARAQRGRTIAREQNIQTVGNSCGFCKTELYAQ